MIHSLRNIRSTYTLSSKVVYNIGGDKRKKTAADLDNYDVVWVGANLGGICRLTLFYLY